MGSKMKNGLAWLLGGAVLLGGQQGWKWYNTPDPEPSAQAVQVIESLKDPADWKLDVSKGVVLNDRSLVNDKTKVTVKDNGTVVMKADGKEVVLSTLSVADRRHIKKEFSAAADRVLDMNAKAKEKEENDLLTKLLNPKDEPKKADEVKVEPVKTATEVAKAAVEKAKAIAPMIDGKPEPTKAEPEKKAEPEQLTNLPREVKEEKPMPPANDE